MVCKTTLGRKFAHLVKTGLSILFYFIFNWSNAQNISQAEYFFDIDPGPGNGTAISFVAGDPVTFTETINTTGLEPGYHLLFVRTRTSTGHWSLYEPQQFIIDGGIIAAEYFFDVDPGLGNGTPLSITPVTSTITTSISTSALEDGEHFLFIRTRHDDNTWSLSDPQVFYIRTRIVAAEYFIDTDPGFGNGTPLAINTPSDLITISPTVSTPFLSDGNHYLFIRTKDIHGKWSHFEPQLFQVDAALPIELLEFEASVLEDSRVKLNWTTVTEINNDFFTVEHAVPGREFTEIGQIPGAGTTTTSVDYEKIHEYPQQGINYYRLKQTDFDGRFTYSKVVSVTVESAPEIFVYPNPIAENWVVQFSGDLKTSRLLELFDLRGRKLMSHTTQGEHKVELTRQGLPAGTYLLRITSSGGMIDYRKINFR